MTDVCLLLDCILDEHFTDLYFIIHDHSPAHSRISNRNRYLVKIVETVSHHNATTLNEIKFSLANCVKLPKPAEAPLARSFAAFTALIKLELFFDCALESDCIQFYMYLGSSCPNLKHLKLDKFSFGRKQKLALVLGPNAQLIHQSVIKKLRGPNGTLHRLYCSPKNSVSYVSLSGEFCFLG